MKSTACDAGEHVSLLSHLCFALSEVGGIHTVQSCVSRWRSPRKTRRRRPRRGPEYSFVHICRSFWRCKRQILQSFVRRARHRVCKYLIRTHICQQVRQHNPRCIDKVIQVIRYCDEGRRHDRRIESRNQEANKEPMSVRTARQQGMEPYVMTRTTCCKPLTCPGSS